MRPILVALAVLSGACSTRPTSRTDGGDLDAPIPPGTDAPIAPGTDVPIAPGTDAPIAPGTDAPIASGTDTPVPTRDFCRLGCATSTDCTTASAAFDADNYACTGGVCEYEGCNTDDECRSTFSDSRYVCRDVGAGTPTCTRGCTTASDCTTPSAAYDADNCTCDAGACRYLGCNTDDECRSTFSDARYVCRDVEVVSPVPLPTAARNCVLGCTTSSDCTTASPAFDADNYECISGSCRYLGCVSSDECRATFSDARYVCG